MAKFMVLVWRGHPFDCAQGKLRPRICADLGDQQHKTACFGDFSNSQPARFFQSNRSAMRTEFSTAFPYVPSARDHFHGHSRQDVISHEERES